MYHRSRLQAFAPLLAVGLCLACTTAEPAPSESPRAATGPERAVQAVAVATLGPQATIEAPPGSPASAAAGATLVPTDTPAPPAATPTKVSKPSPTAGPAGTPVPPATTSPSVTPSPSSTPTPTPTPTATPTPTGTPDASPTPIVAGGVALTPREQWLLDAHNAERLERGIPPLQVDGRLQRIARERASVMADNDLFSHYSPSGETIYDLMAAAGYVYASDATENIHYNDVAPSQADAFAMREYMASPPHRANILDPNLVNAGFAMETSASGVHYYSVVLAD